MAHIADGILSLPVLTTGAVLAVGLSALALRRAEDRDIVRAAVMASVFFAGSLIAVPVGPSSVHLMFGGLMGLILGPVALPAVLAALGLQLVLFGFGGVTTLGVNAVNIALPGILAALALRGAIGRAGPGGAALLAGLVSAMAVLGTGGLVALSLALSSPDFAPAARVMILTYLPLAVVEAAVGAAAAGYLHRARPGEWLGQRATA